MTSPEQYPDPDPGDDTVEQSPLDDSPVPAPETDAPPDAPLTDADIPASDLALEPDEDMIPESDRAPGILGETPVGGKLPPERPIPTPPAPDTADESALRDMPAPQDLTAAQPAAEDPPAPEHEIAMASAPDLDSEAAPAPDAEPASPADTASAAQAEGFAPEAITSQAEETVASTVDADTPAAGVSVLPETPAPLPPAPPPPDQAAPSGPSIARAQDWDEDLSPELAAVLFGGASARSKPAEAPAPAAPPETATTPAAPAQPAAAAAPVPEAAPVKPGAPVMVTTAGEARTRPLSAGQFTAPPPDAPVQGKMRYVRVEEPLRRDQGRRIHETWEYIGPDYPALDGRLVKSVESEEFAYADGSWKLTFRRTYSEGRDERMVRISSDGEYAERTDRIQRRDANSNKKLREREQVGLRYAASPREEKRGFLSNLLGRGNGPQTEGPKSWRPASEGEMRDGRDDGGQAFHYKLFERR